MKHLVVLVSALLVLAVSAPASATTEEAICLGTEAASADFGALRDGLLSVPDGPACLKACNSGLKGCNKFAKARYKCLVQGTKSISKNVRFYCLADGRTKPQCVSQSKVVLERLAWWKNDLDAAKQACTSLHQDCRLVCGQ